MTKWIITKCKKHNPCLALKRGSETIEHYQANSKGGSDCEAIGYPQVKAQ